MKIPQYTSLTDKEQSFKNNYTRINNIDEFKSWYETIKNDSSSSIYRGVCEAKYKNYTSAQRFNYIHDYEDLPYQTQISLELDELRKSNNRLLERYCSSSKIFCSDLYLLSFAQHYGGISPLIDFTKDINKALFFMTDGISLPDSGAGDDRCGDISNYCSMYYYRGNEIGRTSKYIEAVVKGTPYKKRAPRIMSMITLINYYKTTLGPTFNYSNFLSYSFLREYIISPGKNRVLPVLIEKEPFTDSSNKCKDEIQLIISNLNFESQNGCFIFHTHYDVPLEYGLVCVDIHKSIVPYIEQQILEIEGIKQSTIYPDNREIVKDALYKSLAREDIMAYYYM